MAEFNPAAGIVKLDISEADKENILEGYNGKDLPSRLIGPGILSRIFITATEAGDPMLKVLYKSTHPEYEGFPVWDNVTLTPAAAFKWAPFCELLSIDVSDLATGMKVDTDSETSAGYPVYAIETKNGTKNFDDGVEVQFSVIYRTHKETGNRWPELQFLENA